MKKCPFCAEEIQLEAIKCKYCGEWLCDRSSLLKSESETEKSPSSNSNISNSQERLHKGEDKTDRVIIERAKKKRVRKWGWGWIILYGVYALGSKNLFHTHTTITFLLEVGGIISLLVLYFWLRKKFIHKKTFEGRKWLASLLAGIISFIAVTIPIGFILGLMRI